MRQATAPLHREAERSGIVRDLLRGSARPSGLALLLRNLLPVYQALEHGLDQQRGTPLLQGLYRPEVCRAAALQADVDALGGALGGQPALLPAAVAYADRVQLAGSGDGAGLIGFAYVRYMGDLAGGVLLSRVVSRTLGLAPLRFYTFAAIADLDVFRTGYRSALDQAGARLTDVTQVVNAAVDAFRLDIALSIAVAGQAGSCV